MGESNKSFDSYRLTNGRKKRSRMHIQVFRCSFVAISSVRSAGIVQPPSDIRINVGKSQMVYGAAQMWYAVIF